MPAGIMTLNSVAKASYPGVKVFYGLGAKALDPQYSKIFEQVSSERAFEEYVGHTDLTVPVEMGENESISFASMEQGFIKTFRPVVYSLGYIISFQAYMNNLYKQLNRQRAMQLPKAINRGREIVHANIFNNACASSGHTGSDGVTLGSLVHPYKGGSTWSNKLSSSSRLNELALETACIQIRDYRTESGNKNVIRPQRLIVSPTDEYNANRLLFSTQQPGNANNDINALKYLNRLPKGVTVLDYLTSTTRWFIQTDAENGLITINRYKSGPLNDTDFNTRAMKFAEIDWYDCGWADPRCVLVSDAA